MNEPREGERKEKGKEGRKKRETRERTLLLLYISSSRA